MARALPPRLRDLLFTGQLALVARLIIALVAWNRFPPADDGVLYSTLARRLAAGAGYTWRWPDGAVTPVAHYPVGYPALLAVAYRLLGDHVASAVVMHALLGAVAAVAVHAIAAWSCSARAGRWAGGAVALHPALLAYTPAVMTEGVWAALLTLPFAVVIAARAPAMAPRWRPRPAAAQLLAGVLMGAAALVRPQALLVAPFLAWIAGTGPWRSRVVPAAGVALGTLLAVAPWTIRNERAFGVPVLVSANSGWNLLIGADAQAEGHWRPLEAPVECREVWGEAEKDACFGRAARRQIMDQPLRWAARVPAKLSATFDYGGSGVSYLSRSRPDLVPHWMVLGAGAVETIFERGCVFVGLLLVGFAPGKLRRFRRTVAIGSVVFLVLPYAWVAYVGLACILLCTGRGRLEEQPMWGVTFAVLAPTIATHAVFFGASRYALGVQPWLAAMAFIGLADVDRGAKRAGRLAR